MNHGLINRVRGLVGEDTSGETRNTLLHLFRWIDKKQAKFIIKLTLYS